MMLAYESEISVWQDHPVLPWMEWMEVTGRYRGIQSGVRYAEAFRPLRKWGNMSSDADCRERLDSGGTSG